MFAFHNNDVEYNMLNLLGQKVKRKAHDIFKEFKDE
jgi:hypothetical protein